ncbi:hypothetical protein [Streptomyces sp. TRM68367]|nr:hypothetical protein [Streptomyces sp. TRM68367]
MADDSNDTGAAGHRRRVAGLAVALGCATLVTLTGVTTGGPRR